MRLIKLFLRLALVTAALSATGVFARDLTDTEKGTLAAAVADFNTAMLNKDVAGITMVVPPKVVAAIAANNGMTTEALQDQLAQLTTQVMSTVTFDEFGMDLDAAIYKETPDGQPYALIPTHMTMHAGTDPQVKSASQTFAMMDEGVWYLIRTDDQTTLTVVKQVYPSYAAEDFPAGTMEPVTQ